MRTKKRVVMITLGSVGVLALCALAQLNPTPVPAQPGMVDAARRPMIETVVTTKRIAKGAVIRSEDVTLQGAYGPPHGFQSQSDVVGKKAARDMETGYQITSDDLQSALSKSPQMKPDKEQQKSDKQERKK